MRRKCVVRVVGASIRGMLRGNKVYSQLDDATNDVSHSALTVQQADAIKALGIDPRSLSTDQLRHVQAQAALAALRCDNKVSIPTES